MTAYDKPKRKNIDVKISISHIMSSIVHYALVAPLRWSWRLFSRFMGWSWRSTVAFIAWSWKVTMTIAKNTIFAPFIWLGRMLGFVASPVPEGLSPQEAEVYQRINRLYRRQKRWYLHIIVFLMNMAVLWATELLSPITYPRWDMVITITVVWLIALGGHRVWMNLGDSEDRAIGDALHQMRKSKQVAYYEEEVYDEQVDISRLEEIDLGDEEWIDGELPDHLFKNKRDAHN